jgi:hypothetical protein
MAAYGAMVDDVKKAIEELDCKADSSKKFTFSRWVDSAQRVLWETDRINWAKMPSDSGFAYVHENIKSDLIQRLGSADRLNKICSWNVYQFLNNPNPNSRIATELKPYISKPNAQVTLNDIIAAEQQWANNKRQVLIKSYTAKLGRVALDEYEITYTDALKAGKSEAQAALDAENNAQNAVNTAKEEEYTTSIDESNGNGMMIAQVASFGIGILAAYALSRR